MKTLVCFLLLLGSLSIFAQSATVGEKSNPDCDELLQGEKRPEGERKEDKPVIKEEDKKKSGETKRS